MAQEHVYVVSGAKATPAQRITLGEAGLLEREHLQEWVLAHPEILGEDALIITFEFDKWLTAAGSPTWERLDVLALDRSGRLVVAELKRDKAPDTVMVQALNYAAMARRFTLDLLVETYAANRRQDTSTSEPIDELREWAPAISDDSLAPPRVVLIAEDFGPVMTNTAMFLIEQGLDLRLIRIQLYRLSDDTLALTASQLLPVPDVEEFMVRPRSVAQTQRSTRAAATRRASVTDRLVSAAVLADGDELQIVVPVGTQEDRDRISAWLEGEPSRCLVRWQNEARAPARWAVDGDAWNLTTLIRHIIEKATDESPRTQVWGPNWYQTRDGVVLYKIAEGLTESTEQGRFDWQTLHDLMRALPRGSWTTYGDLAEVVGTAAQPLGNHVTHCSTCDHAWRVLGGDGRPRPNFRWADPNDRRTQQEALEAEGLLFDRGSASTSQRLTSADLTDLIPTSPEG
ncbi:MAG: hypothetical protein ACJ735_07480 [Actinomycetes bacterium]